MTQSKNNNNPRLIALKVLRQWDQTEAYAENLIDKAYKNLGSHHSSDRALATNLVYTTLRNRSLLNAWIGKLRQGKLNIETRRLLQLGLTQILLLEIPPHAAVNETVALAKHRGTLGLLNAILRRADRDRAKLEKFADSLPPNSKFSTPLWLIERWNQHFGREATLELLAWNNQIPKNYARINPIKVDSEHPLDSALEKLTPHPEAKDHLLVKSKLPQTAIDAGQVYITDPSTRFAVEALAPKPGETILDACAAPGGKAAHIAAQMNNQGKLTATDSQAHRLPRLAANLDRLGVINAETVGFDWTQPCPNHWRNHFDGVLLDVPCSNSGVIQRRVDVRWRINTEELARLTQLQLNILTQASQAVKPGGRLIYSTCSIDPQENLQVVQTFLSTHPNWHLDQDFTAFPPNTQSDGAYAAKLVRQAQS